MKKKKLITSVIIMFVLMSCSNFPYQRYPYEIQNNLDSFIKVYIALSNNGGVYPDTLLSFTEDRLIVEVRPFEKYHSDVGASWEEIWSYFPKDTMSIYIFSKDTLDSYSWEDIQQNYKILRRYDLSLSDLQKLNYTIPYPPTETMKNMKMYPPHGE
jgi:hypothetical protein